ncbi:hypothetical protein WJT74_08320 [Sphingomicrobium sp. XHP0239]|uniref:hypothetical protein n=1 Tax=Sphingomicrobium maritimum TaxID=3133972 RepID=UPI0031CC8F93
MKQIAILALGAAAFAATPAAAQPAHAKGGKNKNQSSYSYGYAQQGCPPGLAKKNNGCQPPGQAKKRYERGYRFDARYDDWTPYDRLPYDVRRRYDLDPRDRYIYDNNYVYRVDPTTLIVRQVLDAIF